MPVRVAINGFGRVGRSVLRAAHERDADNEWGYANRLVELAERVMVLVAA
jgi:glyceraldehyde-3-phosphate dehydrogenase/erythrose-4-phosphate dehydrogenase